MSGRRKIEHSCLICGERFYSVSHNAKYCGGCRIKFRKEINAESHKRAYEIKKNAPQSTTAAIMAEIREIERYNKEHRASLTYGQYQLMKKEKTEKE